MSRAPLRVVVARAWAFAAVLALLVQPMIGLASDGARGLFSTGLSAGEWIGFVVIVGLFAWGEGVMALARRWVPSVDRRIRALDETSPALELLLAPLAALFLYAAPASTLRKGWLGAGAILAAIAIVSRLADPWRSMIEVGVACALAIGPTALVLRVMRGGRAVGPSATAIPEDGGSAPATPVAAGREGD